MEFYEQLLLSVISILLVLLIGKISSGVGDGRHRGEKVALPADRAIEQSEIGGNREGLGEQAETVGGIRGASVDDGCGINEEVLGADRVGSSEVEEEIVKLEDEKFVESGLERSDEARANEFDLEEEEENREDKKSEVNNVMLEEDSAKELPVEMGKIDADFTMVGVEVDKVVQSPGVRPLDEEGYETAIGREEKIGIDKKGGSLLYGEDEWEGIERNEVEKLFGVATEYVGSENGGNALSKLSSDVQKQLYGLQKVATEGPCYEPQPLALKVSARAKWHAWKTLGNMDPEVAMEQYITLLSESIPGWMAEKPRGDTKHDIGNDSTDAGVSRSGKPDLRSFLHRHPSSGTQRILEDPSCIVVDNATTGPKLFETGLTKTFLFNLLSPTRVTFLIFCW